VSSWEHDGSMTVIADQFDGTVEFAEHLVAHRMVDLVHRSAVRRSSVRGRPDDAGGPATRRKFNPRTGAENVVVAANGVAERGVSLDPSGKLEVVVTEAELADPNGFVRSD